MTDQTKADYLAAEVEKLMNADDAELVPFFTEKRPIRRPGFADDAAYAIADAYGDEREHVQVMLAVLRGDYELARQIAERVFRAPLEKCAREAIEEAAAAHETATQAQRHE